MAHKLFEEIGPRYADRPGGYIRILKLGPRPRRQRADGADRVRLGPCRPGRPPGEANRPGEAPAGRRPGHHPLAPRRRLRRERLPGVRHPAGAAHRRRRPGRRTGPDRPPRWPAPAHLCRADRRRGPRPRSGAARRPARAARGAPRRHHPADGGRRPSHRAQPPGRPGGRGQRGRTVAPEGFDARRSAAARRYRYRSGTVRPRPVARPGVLARLPAARPQDDGGGRRRPRRRARLRGILPPPAGGPEGRAGSPQGPAGRLERAGGERVRRRRGRGRVACCASRSRPTRSATRWSAPWSPSWSRSALAVPRAPMSSRSEGGRAVRAPRPGTAARAVPGVGRLPGLS